MKLTRKIKDTTVFIMKAHSGQKYGSMPYWTHPHKVAEFGQNFFGFETFDETATIAALTHDVLEDTDHTRKTLFDFGYSDEVLDIVELVTKDSSLSYFENIDRIINSENRRAMMVKFADNYVNYKGDKSDWEPSRRQKSNAKYLKSMTLLADALDIGMPADVIF